MNDSSQIGRFAIRSLLGKGSMGVVYCAYDPQLDREVAIKTIHLPPGRNRSERNVLTHRLVKEARMAARLNHPGIVNVYDCGEHKGEPYLVLEKIAGEPLSDLIASQGLLAPEVAMNIMGELLTAIAYAHEQGIIHRDLKPANIMVQPDGHVRIMDFGIAHAVVEPSGGAGSLAGTPRYMSPEQIQGQPIDVRSDVFSLGVIFYELLSGRRPFPQNDFAALKKAIVQDAYPPLYATQPDLPASIYLLIDQALSKSKTDRFASARQMLEALQKCRDNYRAPDPAQLANDDSEPRSEIIDFILQKIARSGDFPTTIQYITNVSQVAANEHASATTIAQAILKDFALTNRILRMVNSPFYSGTGRTISTISRAVVIMGIDAVLDMATTLSLFEHFQNRSDIHDLKLQTVQSLMTALHAREIAYTIHYEHAEEAFICGMLSHLGRLIVAFYFPEEFKAIMALTAQGGMDENAAARKIMRISFDDLSEAVAKSWHLPEIVFQGIRGLDPQHKGPLRNSDLMIKGIVTYAQELAKTTMMPDEERRQIAITNLSARFDGQITLRPKPLNRIVENSVRNAWDISHTLRVNLRELGLTESLLQHQEEAMAALSPEERRAMEDAINEVAPQPTKTRPARLDPLEASDPAKAPLLSVTNILQETVNEISQALMAPFEISDIIMMAMEGLYRGAGFDHVLLALATPARDHAYCRFGLGPRYEELQPLFHFPLTLAGGLPARCMTEAREIFIGDLSERSRQNAFPARFLETLGAHGLILMPMMVKDVAIGLFAMSRGADMPPLSRPVLISLRTLVNQSVQAITQSRKKA